MEANLYGVVGVSLLLIAFVLNLVKRLHETHPLYLTMNVIGAGLAAVYAVLTNAWPFVVLEVVWSGVAVVRLGQIVARRR